MAPPLRAALVASTLAATCGAIDLVNVTLSDTPLRASPIAPNFASFSYEISGVLAMIGRSPAPPNPTFVRLMNNLRDVNGGAGPQLRIGGNSAETSVYWPSNDPLPPNQTYAIKPADLESYAAALPLWNGSAVIDTSMFVAGNASWAVAHVAAVSQLMGWDRVDAIEGECRWQRPTARGSAHPSSSPPSAAAARSGQRAGDLPRQRRAPPGVGLCRLQHRVRRACRESAAGGGGGG